MPNRKVKCPYCEEKLPRGEAIRHTNKRYYHKECFDKATADSRHYQELIATICRIWGIDRPTMQMVRQLKLYREDPEMKCTNKGMQLTLEYYYDLLGNKPDRSHGVGIIPLYYDEAREQYIRELNIKKSIEQYSNGEEIVVYVNPNKKEPKKNFIDIDNI